MIRSFRPRNAEAIFGLITIALVSIAFGAASEVKVEAFVTNSPEGTAKTTFAPDTAKIYVMFKTKGAKAGDKFRGVLFADRAGHIAPENSKIIEGKLTLDGDTSDGGVSFSKPIDGWPIGEYHVEIYINDQLATKANFKVEAAK